MDYILFNEDGSIKATKLTDFINQGSDNANSIFVGIENLDNTDWDCYVNYILPSQEQSGPYTVTDTSSQTIDDITYEGWLIYLGEEVTVYEGILYMSLYVRDTSTQETLWTFKAKLTINPSTYTPEVENITLAQYNNLIDYIDGKAGVSLYKHTIVISDYTFSLINTSSESLASEDIETLSQTDFFDLTYISYGDETNKIIDISWVSSEVILWYLGTDDALNDIRFDNTDTVTSDTVTEI